MDSALCEPAGLSQRFKAVLGRARTVFAETLWPTRCAICDQLGSVLCDRCRRALPYIDYWLACQRCGASWGRLQCCQCNGQRLRSIGIDDYPLDQMATATKLTAETHRIVTVYKDQGERRLAAVMAECMVAVMPATWLSEAPVVCAIPASERAIVRRGFDHGALLGQAVAELIGRPFDVLLEKPHTSDQRQLRRDERLANMLGNLQMREAMPTPHAAIVVDDVSTTGATLIAAALALRAGGVERVFGLTFTRT